MLKKIMTSVSLYQPMLTSDYTILLCVTDSDYRVINCCCDFAERHEMTNHSFHDVHDVIGKEGLGTNFGEKNGNKIMEAVCWAGCLVFRKDWKKWKNEKCNFSSASHFHLAAQTTSFLFHFTVFSLCPCWSISQSMSCLSYGREKKKTIPMVSSFWHDLWHPRFGIDTVLSTRTYNRR